MNILITGGASGLGASISQTLLNDKNNFVYFTYHHSVNSASLLELENGNIKGIKCNFNDPEELNLLLRDLSGLEIDVLINNAFSTKISMKHFHKMSVEDFEMGFSSNIIPTIKIVQTLLPKFRKKKFGKIITILSSAIINKPPLGYAEYVAAKAYLHSLAKSWASENANYGITSNCISPSFMKTNLTSDTDDRVIEEIIANHPLKRLLTPLEVADSVMFLVNCSQQINGINLTINSASNVI